MSSFSAWRASIDLSVQPHVVSVAKNTAENDAAVSSEEGASGGSIEHVEQKELTYKVSMVHGQIYPVSCGPERWENLNQNIIYRSSDVIIATYPKCGTTWIEQVTLLLLHPELDSSLLPASKNTYHPFNNPVGKIWPEAASKLFAGD
jgi:hypothetical protein